MGVGGAVSATIVTALVAMVSWSKREQECLLLGLFFFFFFFLLSVSTFP